MRRIMRSYRRSAPFAGSLVRRLPVAVECHARDPTLGSDSASLSTPSFGRLKSPRCHPGAAGAISQP